MWVRRRLFKYQHWKIQRQSFAIFFVKKFCFILYIVLIIAGIFVIFAEAIQQDLSITFSILVAVRYFFDVPSSKILKIKLIVATLAIFVNGNPLFPHVGLQIAHFLRRINEKLSSVDYYILVEIGKFLHFFCGRASKKELCHCDDYCLIGRWFQHVRLEITQVLLWLTEKTLFFIYEVLVGVRLFRSVLLRKKLEVRDLFGYFEDICPFIVPVFQHLGLHCAFCVNFV